MQVGEWLEIIAEGYVTKKGNKIEKPFGEKAVWVVMKGGGNLGNCFFVIPYSMMLPYSDGKPYRVIEWRGKKCIMYRMTVGAHRGCTWGGKKSDGTPRFKSTRYGTTGVRDDKGGFKKAGGLTKSDKQYYCKNCNGKVYIERDNEGNAYCVDCGKKMFG